MKWSLVSLVLVGVLAALGAGLLVVYLRNTNTAGTATGPEPQAQVVVAARPLEPMTVIDESCVSIVTMPASQAPPDRLSSPVQVLGKVLVAPMVQGKRFTAACFAPEGSSAALAANLPEGMRAVSLSLDKSAAMAGVLYPGAKVDVLAALKGAGEELVSTTLLERVTVLAADDETIQGKLPGREGDTSRGPTITVMVSAEQAKILQLAMERGRLSLAMRNPIDATEVGPSSKSIGDVLPKHPPPPEPAKEASPPATAAPSAAEKQEGPPSPPVWKTLIIRGSTTQTVEFPKPEGGM
jgi:pilus assembly protein CpaB